MPSSIPNECFTDVLSFLDGKSLYKCLFVNRFYCKLSIPIIWRDPFTSSINTKKCSLINTLLAGLNEDEIASLIPCAINVNNQPSLFEYGKFIRKIDHEYFVRCIIGWLKSSGERDPTDFQDCRVEKLINAIYHMIMRKGSNLQEFVIDSRVDLPKFSIFTTYKPGITNLRSFNIYFNFDKCQNTIEFLSMVSYFCNGIINCELGIKDLTCTFLNFIKLQPLERIMMFIDDSLDKENVKKILYALEFRSETLKKLSFEYADFRGIDLSFLSKFEYLECLEFYECSDFTLYEALFKKKLHLKELKLLHCKKIVMIDSFFSETLLELKLTIDTPEIIRVVKDSCPNISSLQINNSELYFDSIIPIICELSSLRILFIKADLFEDEADLQVRILGDYLTSVEYLFLDFHINLPSFEYFTNNCKANLKKWVIVLNNKSLGKDYLIYVNNYQKVHNSLKVLGIEQFEINACWTSEELGIIDSLKKQETNIVSSDDIDEFLILLDLFVY